MRRMRLQMNYNESEAKRSSEPKIKESWEPMKLSYAGHIREVVQLQGKTELPPCPGGNCGPLEEIF
jgi:hypothetical protein